MIVQTHSFELAIYARGNESADKLALVLPGRLDTKDYAHMTSHVDYLASIGYYAISFDPPGTWESPGPIDLYTTTNYLKAINELIEHYGNKPTVLVGHSRGGTIALLAGATNPYVTNMVAIMSPHGPSTKALAKAGDSIKPEFRDLPPGTHRTTKQKRFVMPYGFFEDQKQYSVLNVLRKSSKPKLLFYATDDAFVSKATVTEIFNVSAEPKILHELLSEHDYRLDPKIIDEVNTVMSGFLSSY
jgi:pimeloyl-ACP methyl ester carboxylesterase